MHVLRWHSPWRPLDSTILAFQFDSYGQIEDYRAYPRRIFPAEDKRQGTKKAKEGEERSVRKKEDLVDAYAACSGTAHQLKDTTLTGSYSCMVGVFSGTLAPSSKVASLMMRGADVKR